MTQVNPASIRPPECLDRSIRMSTTAVIGSAKKQLRMEARELFRSLVLTALWVGFFSWCWVVFRGPGVHEMVGAAEMVAVVLRAYLAALVWWICTRWLIDRFRKSAKTKIFEEPAFTRDYFGRDVVLAREASFADQHLVLEYSDGRKVYRRPTEKESAAGGATASLLKLAAAAGQSTSPSVAPIAAEERNV